MVILLTIAPVIAFGTPESASSASVVRKHAAKWSWPTPDAVIIRPWEAPASRYAAGHRGVDVPAPTGAAVHAPDDGLIAFAGPVAGRQVVTIDHGGGIVSTLDPVTPAVQAGEPVHRGDVIGHAEAGHCSDAAPCVHLGARINGEYVDPTSFLSAPEWPVLLPLTATARGDVHHRPEPRSHPSPAP